MFTIVVTREYTFFDVLPHLPKEYVARWFDFILVTLVVNWSPLVNFQKKNSVRDNWSHGPDLNTSLLIASSGIQNTISGSVGNFEISEYDHVARRRGGVFECDHCGFSRENRQPVKYFCVPRAPSRTMFVITFSPYCHRSVIAAGRQGYAMPPSSDRVASCFFNTNHPAASVKSLCYITMSTVRRFSCCRLEKTNFSFFKYRAEAVSDLKNCKNETNIFTRKNAHRQQIKKYNNIAKTLV